MLVASPVVVVEGRFHALAGGQGRRGGGGRTLGDLHGCRADAERGGGPSCSVMVIDVVLAAVTDPRRSLDAELPWATTMMLVRAGDAYAGSQHAECQGERDTRPTEQPSCGVLLHGTPAFRG